MFLFNKRGLLQFQCNGKSEDEILDAAIEAGIEDFSFQDDEKTILEVLAITFHFLNW